MLNCTRSGEEGCDGRLGDEFAWLKLEGEDGLLLFLFWDSVRCNGIGNGLPSSDGPDVLDVGPEFDPEACPWL